MSNIFMVHHTILRDKIVRLFDSEHDDIFVFIVGQRIIELLIKR